MLERLEMVNTGDDDIHLSTIEYEINFSPA